EVGGVGDVEVAVQQRDAAVAEVRPRRDQGHVTGARYPGAAHRMREGRAVASTGDQAVRSAGWVEFQHETIASQGRGLPRADDRRALARAGTTGAPGSSLLGELDATVAFDFAASDRPVDEHASSVRTLRVQRDITAVPDGDGARVVERPTLASDQRAVGGA